MINYKELEDQIEQKMLALVFAYSQENCPVDTGALKSSGRIIGNQVAYDMPYAVYVHEIPGGRGFKFLERAILKAKSEIL